jgi:hypothetical protein
MNFTESTKVISVTNFTSDINSIEGVGVPEHSDRINSNLSHDRFIELMGDSGLDVQHSLSIIKPAQPSNANGLSNTLIDIYSSASNEYVSSRNSALDVLGSNEKIEFDDVMAAKKELHAMEVKTTLAIKATEKAMETFNQMLRMN